MIFAYDLQHWLTFLTAAVLLNLSPGPDMAFIIGHTVKSGRRAGLTAMIGIWSGALFHVGFAVVGLSALLATSALAFSVVKYVGAAYLVWLGIQAWRSKGENLNFDAIEGKQPSLSKIYWQGLLIDLLNPKVAIFFLAFLPQFVEPGAGSASAQFLLHGLLIIVVAAVIEPPLILVGDRMAARLRESTRFRMWLDRSLGSLLILLGIKLAVSER